MTEPKVDRAPCLCGCGGTPKGKKSRFIPGHDARYHAAQKRATIIEQLPPVESEDGIIREFTRESSPVTPVRAKAQEAPPAPSRRRAVKKSASCGAGSKA